MRIYITLFILAILTFGCTPEDTRFLENTSVQEAALKIQPTCNGQIIDLHGFQQRGIVEEQYLPSGSEIGVFVHNLSTDNCVPNLRWQSSGEGQSQLWRMLDESGAEGTFFLNQQYSRLYAYYPYTSAREDLWFAATASQTDRRLPALRVHPGYIDYLIGSSQSAVSATVPYASIEMNHALACLIFKVEKKPGYPQSGTIGSLFVTSQPVEAWLSLQTGEPILPVPEESKILLPVRVDDPARTAVLVIPQLNNESNGVFFDVTIDGRRHQVQIPRPIDNQYLWEKGRRYTYRFCLNANGGVTVELADFEFGGDWDTSFE